MSDQDAMQVDQWAGLLLGRLKELGELEQTVLPRRVPGSAPAVTGMGVMAEVPRGLVPVPRRSRVFLRHGEGHGSFAGLTVTAPRVRHVTD